MRSAPTEAEARLWQALQGRRLNGVKFSRQIAIGSYIADFVYREHRLVIELDGGQHDDAADRARQKWIEAQGFAVLRFWNNDVFANTEGVLRSIAEWLRVLPSSLLPEVGGGAATAPPPTSGRRLGYGGRGSKAAVKAL